MQFDFRNYRYFDWPLVVSAVILILFGIVALYSIGLGEEVLAGSWIRQLVFAVLGMGWVFFFGRFDFRALRGFSVGVYIVCTALLVLVLLFGTTVRGTTGWFVLGPFALQPVEFMKVSLVIILASFLSSWSGGGREAIVHYSIAATLTLLPVTLVFLQPDFGSGMVLLVMGVGMIVGASRLRLRTAAFLLTIALVGIVVAWMFFLSHVQRDRILVFFDPARDPLGRGYNVRQSLIAIGSGGLWGKGVGEGSQGRLHFLPEAETDFIFAVIAEEMGFLGSSLVLLLFGALFWRVYRLLAGARDEFQVLLVWGIGLMLVVPTVINIGMNVGLLPVTGLPLIFVSRGGSSLWASLIAVGILESIALRQRRLDF